MERFTLALGDGVAWELDAWPALQPWVAELARIMELPASSGVPGARHLRFVERADVDSSPERVRAERAGWSSYALGTAIRVWWSEGLEESIVEVDPLLLEHPEIRVIAMWTALRPLQFYAIATGGGPFHSVLADYQGRGVLIAGAAGVGKSTCYKRLPGPWRGLCDDYALVVRDGEGRYQAHPFPTFSEYLHGHSRRTWDSSRSASLSAVCFLERGMSDDMEIVPPQEAATRVFESQKQLMETSWARMDNAIVSDIRRKLFENACTMVATIPMYRLRATLKGRFWEQIEEAVRK